MRVHIPVALTQPSARPRSGTTSTASWDQLRPHIAEAIRLRPNEFITDIVITMDGIQVYIGTIGEYPTDD